MHGFQWNSNYEFWEISFPAEQMKKMPPPGENKGGDIRPPTHYRLEGPLYLANCAQLGDCPPFIPDFPLKNQAEFNRMKQLGCPIRRTKDG